MDDKDFEEYNIIQDEENDEDLLESFSTEQLNNVIIYSSDWTVETILNQIAKGNININPKFQRRDAWKTPQKSLLIESLLLSIPIPNIVLAEKVDKRGTFDVIDGKQRLLSIVQFCKGKKKPTEINDFKSFKLTGLKLLSELNGKTFDDLKKSTEFSNYATIIENATIRTSVIRNSPNEAYLYEIFSRLNTGSLSLSAQELRQSLFPGHFTDFIDDFASLSKTLHELLNIDNADKRMRDTELVMRSFAFKYFLEEYPNSLKTFLDNSCLKLNGLWKTKKTEFENYAKEIENAIIFTKNELGDSAFKLLGILRKNESFNRVMFDLMIYFFSNPNNRQFILDKKMDLKTEIAKLIDGDPELVDALTINTHQTSKVKYRFEKFQEIFN